METILYAVPDLSCGHCEAAVKTEVSALAGVEAVSVDLGAKSVEVSGEALDDGAIRSAIKQAGYEAL